MVFTLPAAIADIAYQNKAVIYDILFTASAETMVTIAADPKHLGARIHAGLADKRTFKKFLARLRRIKWVVYRQRLREPPEP